jgi:hypothetical protein
VGHVVDKSIKISCQPEVRRRGTATNYLQLPNARLKFIALNSPAKRTAVHPSEL